MQVQTSNLKIQSLFGSKALQSMKRRSSRSTNRLQACSRTGSNKSFFLNSLETAEYESGNYENAEVTFTQALEITPNDPLILTNRARNRQLMLEEEEALKDIEKSLGLVPGNTTALYVRAQILISLERFEEAIK